MGNLTDKKFVVLVEDGYEDLECWFPKIRLEEEGAEVVVASDEPGTYASKHGYPIEASEAVSDVKAETVDGVIIPGGTSSPDKLRTYKSVTEFVNKAHEKGKLIAFICHGGWVPISADILEGRTVTGYKAIKDDLINAGARYKDQSVVVDGNLVSSRHPGDLARFCTEILNCFDR